MNVSTTLNKYFHLFLGYEWCDEHSSSYGDLFDECIDCVGKGLKG